jgi:serralysin
MDEIRVCVDRKVAPRPNNERMALVRASKWPPRAIIRAAFLDGDPRLHKRVEAIAQTWFAHAKLTLYFGAAVSRADIRISFSEPGVSWSCIGTDCHLIPAGQATMNYGWLTPDSAPDEVSRVVLHEFGHALGCIHEHQNPAGGILWNKATVYEYYSRPPNSWSRAEVDRNIFDAYAADLTVQTQVDPASIMMYPIPKGFTLDGFEVGWNTQLSPVDKGFIRQMYP